MSVDSAHANIEHQLKVKQPVYDWGDFKECIEKSRRSMQLLEIELEDFKQWKSGKKQIQGTILHHIVCAKFEKGLTGSVLVKHKFTEEFQELSFMKKKFVLALPEVKEVRGIMKSKKDNIINRNCH